MSTRAVSAKLVRRPLKLALECLEDRMVLSSGIPSSWDVRGVGGGGALFSPQINPHQAGHYFIASDMSNVFESNDAGATWRTIDYRQVTGRHESQVQFTSDPNVMYVLDYTTAADGSEGSRAKRSLDGGQTWQPLGNDPTGAGAYKLFADPAGTQRLLLSDYSRLFFSANGGSTWKQVFSTASGNGLHLGGVFWDGNNIYVGSNQGLLVSADGLATNFQVSAAGGIAAGQAILSFAGAKQGGTTRFFVVTKHAATVYAGTQAWDYGDTGSQSIYSFDVGQASWVLRMNGINAAQVEAWHVGMAANNISVAYVAGGSSSGVPTVYKTTDAGLTWTSVFLTTNNQNIATGWQGHQGDRQWTYGEVAMGFTVARHDPNQLIITDYGFGHVSTDGGSTWQALYVAPGDRNPAGAATPKGRDYHDSGLDNTTSWQVAWANANTMFIANSDIGGQRSTTAGQAFNFNMTGQTFNSVYRYAVHPNTGVIYAAVGSTHDLYQTTYLTDSRIDSGTGGVLFSTNQGQSWQMLRNFGRNTIWVALDPTNPNRLYASVVHSNATIGGIYVTNDLQNGTAATWTKLTNPPRTEGHPFNINVLANGELVVSYAARRAGSPTNFTASSGVFYSTDGGQTWSDRSAPGMLHYTKDVVIDPHDATQNTWYAGVWSGWGGAANNLGGLYKTTDRGVSWTRIHTQHRVSSVTFNPTNPDEMWMTTETNGLWYSNNIRAANPAFQSVANFPFRQPERVFYNPFDAHEIWVTSFGGGVRVGTLAAAQPGQLRFNPASYTVNEGDGTVTLWVERLDGSDGAVSVSYATANGSAVAGQDYTAKSGTLSWAAGDTAAKSIVVTILNDSLHENDEAFSVVLSNPTGGAGLGTPSTAVVTIVDNDPPNHPPIARPDRYTMTWSRTLNIPAAKGVLMNDTDPDGDALQAVLEQNPTHGTVTLLANGGFQYSAPTQFRGVDTFTYRAFDGQHFSAVTKVTILVGNNGLGSGAGMGGGNFMSLSPTRPQSPPRLPVLPAGDQGQNARQPKRPDLGSLGSPAVSRAKLALAVRGQARPLDPVTLGDLAALTPRKA
jgi:photosystem II stability/assembly factor-like uncharacterized protein